MKKKFENLTIQTLRSSLTRDLASDGVQMLYNILLGISDMAELIRPHGFQCYETHNCSLLADPESLQNARNAVKNGKLKEAVQFEQESTMYLPNAVTRNHMPSYEVYGHALLFLHLPKVKSMFLIVTI